MEKIIVFGLTEDEIEIIRNCGLRCELSVFDVYTDIIAHYAKLTIINPNTLNDDERSCIADFYREIDPCDEKVILTEKDPLFEKISFVDIIPDFFDFPDTVPIILMKNLKRANRDVDFSRRIMLAIKILVLIEDNPGITTKQLSKMTEQSDRSIKRYIRSLQAAGIFIEFDCQRKGWYCTVNHKELI